MLPSAYDFTAGGTVLTWSIDDEAKATLSDSSVSGVTVTGVSAGEVVVTAEVQYYVHDDGANSSFDPVISDTFTITVEAVT
jgi:hypothetical protein